MPTAVKPGIYDPNLADDNLWIDTEDAYAACRSLAKTEGLLLGISAAANVVAAGRVAQQLSDAGKTSW